MPFFYNRLSFFSYIKIENELLIIRSFWIKKTFELSNISGTSVIPLYKYAPILGNQLKIHLKVGRIPDSEILINMNTYSAQSVAKIRALLGEQK